MIIGILALVMGSAAMYGILNVNTAIQAKPEQIKVPDYSANLDSLSSQVSSLSSQVSSIKNNLPDLSTLTTDLADIHEKLVDLENMKNNITDIQRKLNDISNNNQVQQIASFSGTISITLDKTSYVPGDTVHITATGADPLKVAQVQLLDNNGLVITNQNTWADSNGNLHYDLQLSSSLLPGNYAIKITSSQASGSQQVILSTTNTASNSSYIFTAQTDKGFYQAGDLIQISGMTQPTNTVTAIMASPSGKTFTTSTTANADGTYTMLFSTLSSFETGPWNITLTSIGQTKILSIYLNSGGSSGSNVFTAQTDKTSYNQGDVVQVSGIAQPNTSVNAVMSSPSGSTSSSSATTNSAGSYTISFVTSSSYQTGTWSITVTNLAQNKLLYFTLGTSSSSYTFTAQTDKTTYHKGDIIQVAGTAQSGSAISATMVSPSGNSYDSSATTNSNGSYVLFFSSSASYETGNWYIDVTNLGQHKILSFTLQS